MAQSRTAICALVSALAIGGCRHNDEPPLHDEPREEPSPSVVVVGAPDSGAGDAGNPWVERQILELRDRTLKWTPRETPLRRITFAGDNLFAVLNNHVVIVDASGKSDVVRHSVSGLHRLVALADGAVFAIGAKSTLRIRPNAKAPESVNHVPVFSDSLVFGSASDAARLDVFDVFSGQVMGFGPSKGPSFSSVWVPDVMLDVPELKQAHCGQLLDGTYACIASNQLLHVNPRSRPQSIGKVPAGLPIWKVLGGERADQVWLARDDGQLEKWWLGPPPKRLTSILLPWTPLDVALKKNTVAVVRVVQDRAKPKELTLVVLDTDGRQRFEHSLMPPAEEANVAEREIREAEVVVHGKKPWIAVRTSHGVQVVHAQTGETLVECE